MKRTKSARGAPRGARAAAKRSEDSEEVEGGALKRIVAAGTVAFSVLAGVEGAIEPARAAGSATEIVQLALDAVDPVEDPDAKAEAPERVKADTSSLEGALKAQVQSRKSTVKEAGKKAAKAAAAPAKSGAPEGAMSPNAKDYKSEIGESLATLDYDAIIKKTDDYFVYRYDRGIDESQIIDLDDEDDSATRGPKGTKKRVAVAKSTTAPSFTLPSFTAPSFDAPSFSIPTFEVPSIEIPAIPGATEPATKKDTAAAAKEAGAEAERFQEGDLDDMAADVVDTYEPLASETGLALARESSGQALVRGEPHLLAQALANLLDNAIKYVPAGGRIVIRLERTEEAQSLVVEDNGPGMPEDFRDRAFERFSRADSSRTEPGSGLGLSLVRAVAHLHGGEVRLENAGPGLRASLILPLGTA